MLPKVIAIEYKQRDHIVKVSHERQDVVLGKAKGREGEEDKRPEDIYHFYLICKQANGNRNSKSLSVGVKLYCR
eukprot:scaffold2229_cov176-Ochromonas_danica.AAC.9